MVSSKHVYVYSPSGAVRDKLSFRRGIKFLERKGLIVEVDPSALTSFQRFAGTDEERVAAVARAASSGADVALISRGGYGLTRILGDLPYEAIATGIRNGTRFIGFSDFTALQMALYSACQTVSWSGPALCDGFGAVEPDDIMVDCFFDLLSEQGEGTGWRLPKPVDSVEISNAILWGGNLTTLCNLVGTPFFPNISDGILFFEDVGEHPYRVERALSQLLHAGVLQRQAALVFGQFNQYKLTPHDKGFKLASVVDWLRTKVAVPIFTNLPFGHTPTKVLLPFGRRVDLSAHGRDVFIVWGHE